MSAVYAQRCCGTTTTALMLAILASTKHCIICSDHFGGKVCFQTSMVTYALAFPVNAASVHLSSRLVFCNPCTFHTALGTVSLLTLSQVLRLNAQQRQKHYYDKRHVLSVFDVRAEVLLATTNLHLRITGTHKLIPRWVGPFKVLARMGGTAYRLDLPDCIHQVHNVFHVSPLKAIQKCWWHTTTTTS